MADPSKPARKSLEISEGFAVLGDNASADMSSLEKGSHGPGSASDIALEKPELGSAPLIDCVLPASSISESGDVFADGEGGVKFKTMSWFQTALVMIAETISLGILSLPAVLAETGMLPGCLLIVGLSAIAAYTGVILGKFKEKHPSVHSMADAGEILFGRWGKEILGVGNILFLVFVMASHVLTFSIMMNVTTGHSLCTIVFMVLGAIISCIFTIPKTLKNMSYLSMASFLSVIAAVTVVMVDLGLKNRPIGPVELTRATSIYRAFTGVTNISFAYAGHLTFFGFISEMKKPQDYWKALAFLQVSETSLYLISAVVIYNFTGYGVQSPALTSASPTAAKIAYGIATPTIIISGVINAHVAAKYLIVRKFRNSPRLQEDSWANTFIWIGLISTLWFIAWILAETIPVFNSLLGLIAALFVSWFTFGLNGMFWFHMNRGHWFDGWKNKGLSVLNFFIIMIGFVITGLGLYSSIYGLTQEADHRIFSCANNAYSKGH